MSLFEIYFVWPLMSNYILHPEIVLSITSNSWLKVNNYFLSFLYSICHVCFCSDLSRLTVTLFDAYTTFKCTANAINIIKFYLLF